MPKNLKNEFSTANNSSKSKIKLSWVNVANQIKQTQINNRSKKNQLSINHTRKQQQEISKSSLKSNVKIKLYPNLSNSASSLSSSSSCLTTTKSNISSPRETIKAKVENAILKKIASKKMKVNKMITGKQKNKGGSSFKNSSKIKQNKSIKNIKSKMVLKDNSKMKECSSAIASSNQKMLDSSKVNLKENIILNKIQKMLNLKIKLIKDCSDKIQSPIITCGKVVVTTSPKSKSKGIILVKQSSSSADTLEQPNKEQNFNLK